MLWCIENLDDAGEGMFIVDAPDREAALALHAEQNAGITVTSCEQILWVDLALVINEHGEYAYFERARRTHV